MFNRKDNFDWGFEGLSKQPCGMDLKPQILLEGSKNVKTSHSYDNLQMKKSDKHTPKKQLL